MDKKPKGPLEGVKVIELAHVMAGPVCGLMLADMGADVIKVERVPHGDTSREDGYTVAGESASFLMVNRNKRGIALDLKAEDGKRILERLLNRADVLLENYRPNTMARLGFGYDELQERHPRLVYCAISGFGRTGPYAERAGFDLIAQGMSAVMSYTGEGPGRPPVKCGAPVTDIVAGILAAMGVSAALHRRSVTGQGQMVETSLFEAGIAMSYWQSAIAFAGGGSPGPMGSAHPLNAPYQAFETADGHITLGAANQANWLRVVEAVEAPELAEAPRFIDNPARLKNRESLADELDRIFRTHPTDYWLSRLEAAGVPAGPLYTVEQMHRDPQALARAMITQVPHTIGGEVSTLGLPVKFSEDPGGPVLGAPLLGEDTRAVLSEHGFSEAEIETFVEAGTVIAAKTSRALA